MADEWPDQYLKVTARSQQRTTFVVITVYLSSFLRFSLWVFRWFSIVFCCFTFHQVFRGFISSHFLCCILSLYCTSVVLHFSCFKTLDVAHFRSVAHSRCFVFSLFYTLFVLHVLLFRTFAVLYFRFFSIFCFTRLLLCTFLFNTYLVMHFQFPCCPVPMIPGSMFPNTFQISWSPNTLPLPITFYPPVFVRCFVFLLLLSCTFGLILIFHGLYIVSHSLCSPGGPTYVSSPSVSYFCCFVLSLICTFVVSYFLYFAVSQFRYFTLQLFHTLWFRQHLLPFER